MSVIQALKVINQMEADGIIGRYAIAGAFAAFYYLEPALTEDIDILVSFDGKAGEKRSGLIALDPIFSYLKQKGYGEFRKEGIVIEGWPAQFVPVADSLDGEALAESIDVDIVETSGSVRTRVPSPEHLAAICLRVGRPKDLIRITQFLDENVLDITRLCAILDRHGLTEAWRSFCFRNGIADPCALYSQP